MLFRDVDEFIRFVRYAFTNFKGNGLACTDAPIFNTVRVEPWLLERIEQNNETFDMRPVCDKDLRRAEAEMADRSPFDELSVDEFPIPKKSSKTA